MEIQLLFRIHKLLKERRIKLGWFKDEKKALKKIKEKEIITNNSDFNINLLKKAGFLFFHIIDRADLETVEKVKSEIRDIGTREIVGIGGGKAIDVAKKVAADLKIKLVSFPTAPSHDGLISKNCSLSSGNKRETMEAVYPSDLIVPLNLWKNSGNLRKAGICDLLSNLIALQDISLAERRGEKFEELYKYLSFEAAKLIHGKKEKNLAYGLIMSSLAMEKTSRYCSGSEHNFERLFAEKIPDIYLHGQLAGTGTLVSAKIYSKFFGNFKKLRFNSKNLFEVVAGEMKKENLLEFAIEPLKNINFNPEWLKDLSQIRQDRYSVWNEINSGGLDWKSIIEEIKSAS
jgi:glycerol dehydrogenase-like iron-containing ADH family enzyme